MRSRLTTVMLCAVLALACSDAPQGDGADESGQAPAADAPATPPSDGRSTGPAGEVAPDSRTPEAPEPAATPDAPETAGSGANVPPGVPAEFHPYFDKVPFTWGADAGLAKAAAEGKPAMLFYTAVG